MKVYAVSTLINDEKYAKFLKNLNIYHGRDFPLCKKNQIYKIINRDISIVRVGRFCTTGDLLGALSVEIELSDEDRLYCVPLDSEHHTHDLVRHNHEYLGARLDDVEEFKQASHIFYLANYLHMLEKDEVEREREFLARDLLFCSFITDRLQHWTTDKKYPLKVDISSRGSGRGKNVEDHVTFTRFRFDEVDEWIRPAAKALGFYIYLYRDKECIGLFEDVSDTMNRENFIEIELVFKEVVSDWKEKIDFELDGETGARFIREGKWERITRKPYDLVVLPDGICFDQRYNDMLADVVNG